MGEYRSTRGEKPPETSSEKKHRLFRNTVRILIFGVVVVLLGVFIKVPRRVPASGYATTFPYSEVRSSVNGAIQSIEVSSGDVVKVGDVLVRLYDEAEKAALQRAEVEAKRAESELEARISQYADEVRSHSNAVQIASLSLEYAKRRLGITKQLLEKGLASSRDLMSDEHQVALNEMQFNQLNDRDISAGLRQIEALRRQLEAAKAAVRSAKADLETRVIRAPSAGRVLRHTFYVGELARVDQVLYEIFGDEERLVRLRVPERYATRIVQGLPIRIQFRTAKRFARRNWVKGEVFEMRSAIQAEGNNTYRVIYCPYEEPAFDVPPGTTADAEILIGKTSLWRLIFDD